MATGAKDQDCGSEKKESAQEHREKALTNKEGDLQIQKNMSAPKLEESERLAGSRKSDFQELQEKLFNMMEEVQQQRRDLKKTLMTRTLDFADRISKYDEGKKIKGCLNVIKSYDDGNDTPSQAKQQTSTFSFKCGQTTAHNETTGVSTSMAAQPQEAPPKAKPFFHKATKQFSTNNLFNLSSGMTAPQFNVDMTT